MDSPLPCPGVNSLLPCPVWHMGTTYGSSLEMQCSVVIIGNNTVINFKVAKRLDLNCSHYRKEMILM